MPTIGSCNFRERSFSAAIHLFLLMPLSVGDKLGPYEILAPIGAGGMGEVYKARDPRLNRIVAIKHMKGQHTGRFEQEAHAIAALNHPNICQIHDIGPVYLVMEYVEGKPLSGPLRVEEALKLAVQIASAMEEAHSKGILHRDLKPANILVTVKGSAKVLDFGLAKLTTDSDATQTIDGTILGTAAYMSPEQAQGKPLDERSDIFSFGAVLYELLSGQRPFRGGSTVEVLSAVLRDEPTPLNTPEAITAIFRRCLAKRAADRFASMTELKNALDQIATKTSAQQQPSIAVLPFANMSSEKENEYFSDGLAEEILNALTRVPGLKVTARTSAFSFRGKDLDIRKIGEALGVRTILEGSVRRAGNHIRVTAQLINIADGYHLWSERYDRDMTDVFAVQDEMSAAIVDALKLNLVTTKPPHRPVNLEAYHALLRARHALLVITPDGVKRGVAYADEAIALDPSYALAYVIRAVLLFGVAQLGRKPLRETMLLAREAALKALELDDALPEAHAILGNIAAVLDCDWKEALRHYQLSHIEDPFLAAGCACFVLLPLGRFHEAIDVLEKAIARDPLASLPLYSLALTISATGDRERATRILLRMLELHEKDFSVYQGLGELYTVQGMTQDAIEILEKGVKVVPWFPLLWGMLAANYQLAGNRVKAEALLMLPRMASVTGHPIVDLARAYYHVTVGEFDRAADFLERGVEARHFMVLAVAWSSFFKEFRQTPRGRALLAKMNLTDTTL
jgi:serine/threonine protein kinase